MPRVLLCLIGLAILASAADPAFEAATVKLNKKGGGPYAQVLPGRLKMTYYSPEELIAFAYGLRAEQVVGKSFPGRYDIDAATSGQTPAGKITGPLLRKLLEDRFQLKVHRETRQLPVYELKVAKGGIKLPRTTGGCTPSTLDAPPAPAPPPRDSQAPVFFCGHPRTGARGLNRTLEGRGVSMDALAQTLSQTELNRTVLNKTGLTGAFDMNLTWEVDPAAPGLDDGRGGPRIQDSSEKASILTALQEQLGLKLEAGRGPVEVLVIDRIEQPSAN